MTLADPRTRSAALSRGLPREHRNKEVRPTATEETGDVDSTNT